MAYTTINKSTDNFNTVLYTGTDASKSVTGVGFQPDFTWIKCRSNGGSNTFAHILTDAVRGVNETLFSNENDGELANHSQGYLSAFGADGFTVTGQDGTSGVGRTYVGWNWKANGQGSSNTDGSINTTYTSVNTTAGFSISKYTGTGSNATVGHGLGAAPKMVIIKKTSGADDWKVYHASVGATKSLVLQGNNAETSDSTSFNNTAPTTSVFSVGTSSATNTSGQTYIAYCFAEKTGYSKFGSYTGNGNNDGTFVYTGFAPAFLLLKETSAGTNDSWFILDNKRNTYNPKSKNLRPNSNDAEADSVWMIVDFLSNGFKINDDDASINESGKNYIYMAIGQSLVGSNNVPCIAR